MAPGTKVGIEPTNKEKEGFTFAGWKVTEGNVTDLNLQEAVTQFTMPEGNVTVAADYTATQYTVTLENAAVAGVEGNTATYNERRYRNCDPRRIVTAEKLQSITGKSFRWLQTAQRRP